MVDPRIDAIFNPKTVALVGASVEEGKMGNIFAQNLLSGYHGKVYLINHKGGQILSHDAYQSIKDLPEAIDLAVITIPAKAVPAAMRELAEKGTRSAVVTTAGFSETGPEGKALEQAMMEEANKGHIKVVGPVIATAPLAPKKMISLVEVAGEVVVLGLTEQSITMLTKVAQGDALQRIMKHQGKDTPHSPFYEQLRALMSGHKAAGGGEQEPMRSAATVSGAPDMPAAGMTVPGRDS